jgi:hypothetical protein
MSIQRRRKMIAHEALSPQARYLSARYTQHRSHRHLLRVEDVQLPGHSSSEVAFSLYWDMKLVKRDQSRLNLSKLTTCSLPQRGERTVEQEKL